jgi:tetratricopeptide (TPR) repeat protein
VAVPLRDRIVQIRVDLGEALPAKQRYRRGSGCLVCGRSVLTAAHVVAGAIAVTVKLNTGASYAADVDPAFVGDVDGPGPDLALIILSAGSGLDVPALPLRAVDRARTDAAIVEHCHAIGYPSFAVRPPVRDTGVATPSRIRDTAHVTGYIPTLGKLTTGLLSLLVSSAPRPLPAGELAQSEWAGMSGAPVLAEGIYLLGVISEHAPREGPSALTVTPLIALESDALHPAWGTGVPEPGRWWARLGVAGAGDLGLLPTPSDRLLSEARRARLVGSVPHPALAFQKRHTVLDGSKAAIGVGPPPGQYVIAGMGGVGKTQLAAAIARDAAASAEVDLVVWVPASTRTAVMTTYAAAAGEVGVGADDPERACARFLGWLASTSERWVVVLDDVSQPGDLAKLWPPNHETGTTVVTSRRRDASLTAGRVLADIDVFTADQAQAFLSERLPPALADDTEGLARDLGYLPLALSHATAHIIDLELPCSAYRQQFANRKRRLSRLFPDASALFDDSNTATVATTWSISIEKADDLPPVGLAGPLLTIASFLDPNGIPTAVFDTTAVRAHMLRATAIDGAQPDDYEEIDPIDIRSGLANLRRFSLISTAESLVRVHALVQRAVRETLSRDEMRAAVRGAADALLELWPPVERDLALVVALRSNTNVLNTGTESENLWDSGTGAHPLLFRALESTSNAALANAAFEAATRLHEQAARLLGADHRSTLKARHHLADLLGELGNPKGAADAYEKLITDQVRALGPDDPDTLHSRSNHAYRRSETGDPGGAAVEFTHVLADYARLYGADHIDSLRTRQFRADCLGEAGDVKDATLALQDLLKDQLRVLGAEHPHTMITRNSLAFWLGTSGDTAGAIALLEKLLVDRLRLLNPEHPATFTTRMNLAQWHGRSGNPARAVTMLQALLLDRERVLGSQHASTLSTRRALARWRGEEGDPAGAAAELNGVLTDMERILSADHPDALGTRKDLAFWSAQAGDPAGAVATLEKLLSSQIRILGSDHPDTLTTRNDLAYWRGDAGDAARAASELEALLTDRTDVLGPDHPDTLVSRNDAAYWKAEAGDPKSAVSDLEQLLQDRQRILGPNHPQTLATRHDIAYWRACCGDLRRAVSELEQLLVDQGRVLGENHAQTKKTRNTLNRWRPSLP